LACIEITPRTCLTIVVLPAIGKTTETATAGEDDDESDETDGLDDVSDMLEDE
jgi:hypothetical protein